MALLIITYPWLFVSIVGVFTFGLGRYISLSEGPRGPARGPTLFPTEAIVFAVGTSIAVTGILYLLNQPGAVDTETLIQYTGNELSKNPAIENCVLTGLAGTDRAITTQVVKSQIITCNKQEPVNENGTDTDEQHKNRLLEALQNRAQDT